MNKNTLLYAGLIIFGLVGAFIFPAYKLQLSFLYILIVLAMTWDVQGGQMGYNTFGNILFFGIGMYICSSVQIGMFFDLGEWTDAGGEKTFVHTTPQFFQGFGVGILLAEKSWFNCRYNWIWNFRLKRALFCNMHTCFRNSSW